jgi:ubiquinone/menaquinone biosynthesis C-methylase UbiE
LRWLRALAVLAGMAVLLKIVVQILIQLSPRITPPAVAFILHSRIRLHLRDVKMTLAPLDLQPGQRVLEIGAGTGTFTIPLAERVAPHGMVASIELQRAMLLHQARRVGDAIPATIQLHQANALALPFAGGSFDRALMVAVLPMLSDKRRALREVQRVLRPGGLLMVSEELIEPEYVPLAVTRRWCRHAGFEHVLANRTVWFYSLVVRKPVETLA